jgi:lipoprotein-anchoring transpeptidase ErfK/SrfK
MKRRFSALLLAVGLMTLPAMSAQATSTPVAMKPLWHSLDAPLRPLSVGIDEPWVYIDLLKRELSVYRNGEQLERISYLAYGAAGAEALRLQGSRQTPTGVFAIQGINRQSKFRLFFGIDYPTPQGVREAWEQGLLSDSDYRHYRRYRLRYGMAAADTALGGAIGIHGLGQSPLWIHQRRDWTDGCVAVTNDEIVALDRWLHVGTKVVIRG